MKASTSTFDPALISTAGAQRFRNRATGVSPCGDTSERQGANRSVRVIDAAPPAQLAVKDRSYPQPGPVMDPLTGRLVDKMTGKPWKGGDTVSGPGPGLWTR